MRDLVFDTKFDTRSLNKAFKELEAELEQVARGLSVQLWDSILIKTPQYLGRMAASWSYSLNAPQYLDRSFMVDWDITEPLQRGHRTAIDIANEDNLGSELSFKLGDTIWIANGVDHGEGEYAGAVESGEVMLRSVNQPGAPVRRSLDMIGSRYGGDINIKVAQRLKTLRIGGNAS